MTPEKRVQSSEIPENNLLDQSIPADPGDAVETIEESHVAPALVNEADWVDQQIPVPVDDSEEEERRQI